MPNDSFQLVVIDDCDADADLTVRALRRGDVSGPIVRLRDGEEALVFLTMGRSGRSRFQPRRVLLLDLGLPKTNGLEVLRKLRDNFDSVAMPVVILTGSSSSESRLETEKLGIVSYIVKPLNHAAVLDFMYSAGKSSTESAKVRAVLAPIQVGR